MSTNQAKTSNEEPEGLVIIREIIKKIHKLNGKFIFRGENKHYPNISSSLYRFHFKDFEVPPEIMPEIQEIIIDNKNNIISNAKSHLHKSSELERDILSELQHYGGKTTLVDFSHDVYIALFFACYSDNISDYESDGRLILYPYDEKKKKIFQNVKDEDFKKKEDFCFEPNKINDRIKLQKSVFVHAHQGILTSDKKQIQIIPIKKEDKTNILDYLEKHHHINKNTIYNDLSGFIANPDNFKTYQTELMKGKLKQYYEKS